MKMKMVTKRQYDPKRNMNRVQIIARGYYADGSDKILEEWLEFLPQGDSPKVSLVDHVMQSLAV